MDECSGLLGKWFGHSLHNWKVTYDSGRTYEYLKCNRCGHIPKHDLDFLNKIRGNNG